LGLLRYFCIALLFALAPGPIQLAAQSVEIHSEFQRIDPFGRTVPIDRSDYPREILSPEVPRNAHSVFHIAVTVPENTSYFLYVGSNPPNLVETTVYKEDFVRAAGEWIPDRLTPIHMPAFGFLPDVMAMIPGQTTRCYLLDVWVPPNADVRRLRIEVLLKIGIWYVAPMEVRIGAARVPTHYPSALRPFTLREAGLPPVDARIDSAALDCLAGYLLGRPPLPVESWPDGPQNLREVVRRSAEQDIAIARDLGPARQDLWFLAEDAILKDWMRNLAGFRWAGAEAYLRVRDWIYRNVSVKSHN
jgi:hypothetical protein